MKIKLLRILSVAQCWIALWMIVLGIVERARIRWNLSGLGMPIWTGVWVSKLSLIYMSNVKYLE